MIDLTVEEIRKRRRELLKDKYDGSIAGLMKDARSWEQRHPAKVVRLKKQTLVRAQASG